eukprot:360269-Chlamydomonas_euryale.AAC.4
MRCCWPQPAPEANPVGDGPVLAVNFVAKAQTASRKRRPGQPPDVHAINSWQRRRCGSPTHQQLLGTEALERRHVDRAVRRNERTGMRMDTGPRAASGCAAQTLELVPHSRCRAAGAGRAGCSPSAPLRANTPEQVAQHGSVG